VLQICDTYPRTLYVPYLATTSMLVGSAKFRSKGRLPVLSYLHENNVSFIIKSLVNFLSTIYNLYLSHTRLRYVVVLNLSPVSVLVVSRMNNC